MSEISVSENMRGVVFIAHGNGSNCHDLRNRSFAENSMTICGQKIAERKEEGQGSFCSSARACGVLEQGSNPIKPVHEFRRGKCMKQGQHRGEMKRQQIGYETPICRGVQQKA